jgi:hypothetical protein
MRIGRTCAAPDFAVTKAARRITFRTGGRINSSIKAYANRRNRRGLRQELHARGEDADLAPKLWTDWDTV